MYRIRFSRNRDLPPSTSDAAGGVEYVDLTTQDIPPDVRLLPPVSPSKIVCVGRNYAAHAKELGNEVPTEPLIFLKPPSSLIASGDHIVYPALTQSLHFEGEIGVVIDRRARNIKAAQAFDYVRGYTIVNDVTARDLQKNDKQWTRGKGFDTFCPVGPYLVPASEIEWNSLSVETLLNGERRQYGTVAQLIFSLGDILEFVTRFMTLEPGDLIATGTPEGVGPMQPGDSVTVKIKGLGALTNSVIRE
jgi:2-keto-4-pentenoate hydratase/2-oxohepta-3-ene-1,7-dioic acid hydratase in catechol pathway